MEQYRQELEVKDWIKTSECDNKNLMAKVRDLERVEGGEVRTWELEDGTSRSQGGERNVLEAAAHGAALTEGQESEGAVRQSGQEIVVEDLRDESGRPKPANKVGMARS